MKVFSSKTYCVEIEVSDYFCGDETELEFDIVLKNGGHKETDTSADTSKLKDKLVFLVGYDVDDLRPDGNGKNVPENVKVDKWDEEDGELELTVYDDAQAVKLECIGDDDINNVYMEFDGADAEFDVRTSEQSPVYLGFDEDADKEIIKANEDVNLRFLNFNANPTFDFTGTFTWAVEDPDVDYYLYENKDGKLEKVGTYNADKEAFVLRTRTLGSYVMSDKELTIVAEEVEVEKPSVETPVDNSTSTDKVVGTGALA